MQNTAELFSDASIGTFVESLAKGKSLNDVLADLALYIEQNNQAPLFASVLLLDATGKHLSRGAAPSLPESYCKQIDGVEIGPNVGSCGTAVFCGHSIYVVDIETDVLWANFKHLALDHGLRACWSVPIIGKNEKILGAFALYYGIIRNPNQDERAFIERCAQTAALLIEASRKNTDL